MNSEKFLEKVKQQERNVIAIDFDGLIHKKNLG